MPNVPVLSVKDGPRLTVSALLKQPAVIAERILRVQQNQYLVDSVLRRGPAATGGYVGFRESTPLFLDDDVEITEEFAEIPVLQGSRGQQKVVKVAKRTGAVVASREMKIRNDMDAINTQVTQLKNTMVRGWNRAFVAALVGNPNVPVIAASAPWTNAGTAKIKHDILTAAQAVRDAKDVNSNDTLGFEPDSLVIPNAATTALLESPEFNGYQGNIADQNLLYTGKLPNQILGLDGMRTRDASITNFAIVMERNTVGFISDEIPLEATPFYTHGYEPTGGETQSWRSDTTRASVIGIDQPRAACIITGVLEEV